MAEQLSYEGVMVNTIEDAIDLALRVEDGGFWKFDYTLALQKTEFGKKLIRYQNIVKRNNNGF